ncbi:hypothetical protein BH24CHL9_BH24CHL9_10250 [soil metagenome]
MRSLPHATGPRLSTEGRIEPSRLVGFRPFRPLLHVYWHVHDFYELAFVTEGTGRHFSSTGERPVQAGSVVVVPPGVGHGFRLCLDMVLYQCFLRAKAADLSLLWVARDSRLNALIGSQASPVGLGALVVDLDPRELTECLEHLDDVRLRPAEERTPAGELGRLLIVLDLLARRIDAVSRHAAGASAAPALVSVALDHLDRDITYPWTLAELSARLSVHPHHLCHLFSRWVGEPPIAFVKRRRAEIAASLLATTGQSVASVGAAVEWPDPAIFSRAFRRSFGMSPRAYRVQARSPGDPEPPSGHA